jgi:tetratricopeptide (TPR) repeat protein
MFIAFISFMCNVRTKTHFILRITTMLNFFKAAGKKKPDNTRINTYTTLADFYLKNGYQKEARSTLEDMARYYDSIGHDAEAKKALLRAAQIGPAKEIGHLESSRLVNTEQPGYEQRSPQHSDNPESTNVAAACDTGNRPSADRAAEFFDLENALTEDGASAFSSMHANSGPSILSQQVNAPSKVHAAIFREIKISTGKSRHEQSLNVHYTMGIAHQQLRQFDDAIEEFTAALADVKSAAVRETAAGTTAGDCYLQLVTCCAALDKQAKAAQYAEKALTLDSLAAEQRLFFKGFIAGVKNTAGGKEPCFFLAKQLVQVKSALCKLYNSAIT